MKSLPLILMMMFATAGVGASSGASPFSCLPQVLVPMLVRIGDAPPRPARLEGGIETPLSLFDAVSGQLLWSAGANPSAIQEITGMDAGISGSITAIDLDGDGLHDRIYAGDMAARLWRIDLHHGAPAASWATGGMFADFGNAEGRGFLAAPDISLSAPAGDAPWLNLAIGTAAPGNPAANNRLYVLRDHAASGSWSSAEYEAWQPLHEQDLVLVPATLQDVAGAASIDAAGPGWYVELGAGHVIAPAITVAGRTSLAIASAVPRAGACEVFARTGTVDLARQEVVPGGSAGEWSTRLAVPIPAAATFGFGAIAGGVAPCLLGGQRIPGCDVDTRPRRTWWRRTDAP
jgi:hypothetical protein